MRHSWRWPASPDPNPGARPSPWLFRALRILLGVLLVIGGLLGFLPILGFWMLPLGAAILAREIPAVARLAERLRHRWQRR